MERRVYVIVYYATIIFIGYSVSNHKYIIIYFVLLLLINVVVVVVVV